MPKQFQVVYELCGVQSLQDEEAVEEYRILLGADGCKLKTTEIGTKLLEFSFDDESAFQAVVQKKSQMGEKLSGIMVELHTPQISLQSQKGKELEDLENVIDEDDDNTIGK